MKKSKLSPSIIKLLSVFTIAALMGIDQLIKHYVTLYLKPKGSVGLIPKILQLTYCENDGAMMNLMQGKTLTMTIFAVACLLVVIYVIYSGKLGYGVDFWSVVFIAAGGLGNLIDRVFRGYVVDYIEVLFVDFYIFNFADCLVTCAAVVIIISQIYQMVKDSKKNKQEENLAND